MIQDQCSLILAIQALKQRRLSGGTTISATALLAEMAGIGIFATGGLGGVHRGWESTMDISADLTELGRTKVVVVSSGCKGFLDVPATLEYLETQGVGVMTFADGREGPVDFPAFWSRESGVRSPFTLKDEKEAAAIACKCLAFESHIIVCITFSKSLSKKWPFNQACCLRTPSQPNTPCRGSRLRTRSRKPLKKRRKSARLAVKTRLSS